VSAEVRNRGKIQNEEGFSPPRGARKRGFQKVEGKSGERASRGFINDPESLPSRLRVFAVQMILI
jgi:hypothetical protein